MLRGVLAGKAGWGVVSFLVGAGLCVLIAAPDGSGEFPQQAAQDLQTGSPAGCTALALDRHGGRTIAEPCSGTAPQLAVNKNGQLPASTY
jgi:hypothetical protein